MKFLMAFFSTFATAHIPEDNCFRYQLKIKAHKRILLAKKLDRLLGVLTAESHRTPQ